MQNPFFLKGFLLTCPSKVLQMEENLANQRRSYEKSKLSATQLKKCPMEFFKVWYDEVQEKETELENNAMTLSTLDEKGFPKNRVVLLKRFNDEGFVFFTNYTSEKGKSIARNPKVSLSFYWPRMERQVMVKGYAEQLPASASDAYFKVRPRGSQIGAYVSHQSQPIAGREVLEKRKEVLERRFEGKTIARPEFWGGYLVRPEVMEFWQGRPNRLHDRFRYLREEKGWKVERLAP